MSTWRGAWQLAQFEFKTSRGGMVMTAILFTYMAVVGMPFLDDLFGRELSRDVTWAPDFIYLAILPNMGFLLNRTMLHFWRDDPYSRKLAVWRALPISLRHIVLGRLVLMGLVAVPIALLFFGLQYGLSSSARELLDPLAYLNFSLFWLAYSLMTGTMYVYCELGFSGKNYFIICCCSFLIYGPLTYALWLSGETAVERVISAAAAGSWLPALCAWAAASIVLVFGRRAIERRIQSRDLLS
jgi:hypothetical protein